MGESSTHRPSSSHAASYRYVARGLTETGHPEPNEAASATPSLAGCPLCALGAGRGDRMRCRWEARSQYTDG
eukprot:4685301-Prymnesium_polylepis.1